MRHYGSSPEMPIVGSEKWQLALNSLRAQQISPSLSRTDILNSQRLSTIEGDMSAIKKMMARIVESNKHIQKSLEKVSAIKISPPQQ